MHPVGCGASRFAPCIRGQMGDFHSIRNMNKQADKKSGKRNADNQTQGGFIKVGHRLRLKQWPDRVLSYLRS
jgi:hypothetical protein